MSRHLAIAAVLACLPATTLAQQGSYDLKLCNTSESTVIDRAGDTMILAGHARGLSDSMTPGGAFDTIRK